jgi:hypothetical protein
VPHFDTVMSNATAAPTFPSTLNTYPITAKARPACQSQKDNKSVQCHANANPNVTPNPNASLSPAQIPGLQPAAIATQYAFNPSSGAKGQVVAVVVAYDNSAYLPKDLNAYRAEFGLSPCTVANGCLSFVNQPNVSVAANTDTAWQTEVDVDAEMVSAVCPQCKIAVVQSEDAKIADMAATVNAAASAGANVISNSWSMPESSGAMQYASYFNHPGVPIVAGAGDGGYAVGFPADLATVISVGGTTLNTSTHQESAWSLTGSGCSAYVAKPAFQTDTGCRNRTMNDVSIVADPSTGVAVYSTAQGGWTVMGGTSVGAALVAGMYGLQGNGKQVNDATSIYKTPSSFTNVTSGSNGSCSPSYLCTGGSGYNGPTGIGTPHGTGGL